MIRRYQAEIWKPVIGGGSTRVLTRNFKTLASAKAWAERVLERHPTVTTRQSDRRENPWYAGFRDQRRQDFGYSLRHEFVDAPVAYVPSVGELGYW